MAISIHNVNDVNQMLGNRVNNKNKENSGSYKRNSHNSESKQSDDSNDNQSKFSQGLQIFMDTALPGKKVLSELTGIAEMDAVGLQFFIAMQRQFVRLRLSQMNERDDS